MKNFLPILLCLLSLLAFKAQGQNEFITTWKTTSASESITIPTDQGTFFNFTYDYTVDWGDGNIETNITGDAVHTYANAGTYQVKISGDFPAIYFNDENATTSNPKKIISIDQWGNQQWGSLARAFAGCVNLEYNATGIPDLSTVYSRLDGTFANCRKFNGNINDWDVSNITYMRILFKNAFLFDQPLDNWNTANVTNMAGMFIGARNFNQPLPWDVSAVNSFYQMFYGATSFNQPIDNWDVSSSNSFASMFNFAESFNQPLDSWGADVSGATSFSRMFQEAILFNQPLNNWVTSSAQDMSNMFNEAIAFNQPIGGWNTSSVENMKDMFYGASDFNQDISGWDVSSVTTMENMFRDASSFNQNIGNWNTSSVGNMFATFLNATSFDHSLGNWDMSNITLVDGGAGAMLSFAGLSTASYDATLEGWATQTLNSNVSVGADGMTYCSGEADRNTIIANYSWNFGNDVKNCNSYPTDVSISSSVIDENNSVEDVIGTFSTTDADAADTHTYTLVAGTGDTDNGSFNINGDDLEAAEIFDFETKSSYSIRVQADDGNGGTYQKTFSITINDVTEINPATAFITTWETTSASESITIPTNSSETYNYAVDWGDGNIESGLTGDASHTYANAGTYTVSISGDFPRIYFRKIQDGVEDKIFTIQQWGDIQWTSMHEAFQGCSNLNITASDSPNLSNVTDMSSMFVFCFSLDGDIGDWDVSNVENMNNLFFRAESFNADISGWDVSNVTDMSSMFSSAEIFNQNIGSWQVGNVVDMNSMFSRAHSFNQNIEGWDVSQVTDMSFMFLDAFAFNQPLNAWEVMNVTDMRSMFKKDDFFASESSSFNQPLNSWDVSQVSDMNSMFSGAEVFDQNIDNWQVQNVTDMSQMFYKASAFNQDISTWDFSNVTNMDQMFQSATSFDQAIGSWVITNVISMDDMLVGSGLSIANYDATLQGWASQTVQSDVIFGANFLNYCTAETARNMLINTYNWTISDDGLQCPSQSAPFITTWQTDDTEITIPTTGTGYNYDITWTNLTNPGVGDGSATNQAGNYTVTGLSNGDTYQLEINGDFPRILFNENSQVLKIQSIEQWGDIQWTSMSRAFSGCSNLVSNATDNPDLSGVSNFSQMFKGCTNFTGDLSGWNTGNATFMSEMFRGCANFNSDLSGWDVTNVTDMSSLFYGAESFNGDVSNWNVSNVNNMYAIFLSASIFNQDISNWDVSNVQDFGSAFNFAENFNQDLSGWNTSSATNMSGMFRRAFDFDQDLSAWNIENVTDLSRVFENSSMSVDNYDLTIQGWATQSVQSGVTLGADGLAYCNSEDARNSLINSPNNWTIIGDVKDCTGVNSIPTDISLSSSTIDEGNSVGDLVGLFTTTDADAVDTHSYSLVAGAGDTDNNSFSITDDHLKAAEVFDFEAKSSYSIRVQTDDGNGGTFEKEFTITINDEVEKQDQTITFEPLQEKTFGNAAFELMGSASSGLTVTYSSSDENVATINGNTLTIRNAGTTTLTASQIGNEEYNPAESVSQTLIVNKADQEITIENISDKEVEDADFEVVASTTSELELVYSILSGPATINGNLISLTGETGTVEIEVSQTGNSNYNSSVASTTFDVLDNPCQEFEANAAIIQNVNCNGDTSGSFEVNTSNGAKPFTYSIGTESQDHNSFENMAAGYYEITVTDANGCSAITSVEITEPEAIEVIAEVTDSNSIFGNGSISLTVTGGTGSYIFDWNNGETTSILSDLEIGEYSVTVTDEAGCNTTGSYTIGGVTANSKTFELNIYPNPVINQVEIIHGEKVSHLTLIDAKGKIIREQKTKGKHTQLEMKTLPAGMYLIRLDNGKTKRIIKQ